MSLDKEEWKTCFERARSALTAGRLESAESAFCEALHVADSGRISANELADTLEGLAATRLRVNRSADVVSILDRAEKVRLQLLEDTLRVHGRRHVATAHAYHRLAFHNIIRGQSSAAILYFEELLKIKRALHGERHYEVANTLVMMAGIHSEEAEKEKLWQEAADILEFLLVGSGSTDNKGVNRMSMSLRGTLENLAVQAFGQGRIGHAEKYFRRALSTTHQQPCGLCNVATFGRVLLELSNHAECEDVMRAALQNARVARRPITEYASVLADLYDRTGRPADAKVLRGQSWDT